MNEDDAMMVKDLGLAFILMTSTAIKLMGDRASAEAKMEFVARLRAFGSQLMTIEDLKEEEQS